MVFLFILLFLSVSFKTMKQSCKKVSMNLRFLTKTATCTRDIISNVPTVNTIINRRNVLYYIMNFIMRANIYHSLILTFGSRFQIINYLMPESLVLLCQNLIPCFLTFCSSERSIPTHFLNYYFSTYIHRQIDRQRSNYNNYLLLQSLQRWSLYEH